MALDLPQTISQEQEQESKFNDSNVQRGGEADDNKKKQVDDPEVAT